MCDAPPSQFVSRRDDQADSGEGSLHAEIFNPRHFIQRGRHRLQDIVGSRIAIRALFLISAVARIPEDANLCAYGPGFNWVWHDPSTPDAANWP
jgi:hypothetical protein